ncbi:hypothetical protein LCGC14_1234210 [marine sediment metagenome]|uniref:Uncharacterized protein n=1 Tax=marine sediment metagenome TaxID=412755 RepID=A0A0F9L7L5_9ZZZZ
MAEVRQVPGKVYVTVSTDGEVKQVPGWVYFTEEAGGPTAYARTLSAEVGLSASMVRAAAYARTLIASPATGLSTPAIARLQAHLRGLTAEVGLATPAIARSQGHSRTLTTDNAIGLNASGTHAWDGVVSDRVVAKAGTDRALGEAGTDRELSTPGTDREVEQLY